MKFSGEITLKARRDAVFAALADVSVFASLIDGVSGLVPLGDNRYDAVLETKVAYMSFKFKVMVEFTELTPPLVIAAKIEGAPLGMVGRLAAVTVTRLIEDGDNTRIQYEMDSTLTGRLGSIGQPVMKAKAREMEKQFAKNLQARFDTASTDIAGMPIGAA
jgi:carbon monoxide dehydrogenase subunit G